MWVTGVDRGKIKGNGPRECEVMSRVEEQMRGKVVFNGKVGLCCDGL